MCKPIEMVCQYLKLLYTHIHTRAHLKMNIFYKICGEGGNTFWCFLLSIWKFGHLFFFNSNFSVLKSTNANRFLEIRIFAEFPFKITSFSQFSLKPNGCQFVKLSMQSCQLLFYMILRVLRGQEETQGKGAWGNFPLVWTQP